MFWISKDPLGFDAGDSNLYRYVNNRPTVATDPSGLKEPPSVLRRKEIAQIELELIDIAKALSKMHIKTTGDLRPRLELAASRQASIESLKRKLFYLEKGWPVTLAVELSSDPPLERLFDKKYQFAKTLLKSGFPAPDEYVILDSSFGGTYNCIANACGRNDIWMGGPINKKLDSTGIAMKNVDLNHFDNLFGLKKHGGFTKRIQNFPNINVRTLNEDSEYVALYGKVAGKNITKITHAARFENGIWTSKLGKGPKIAHLSALDVESALYGKIIAIYAK